MSKKRFRPEDIIGKLRHADVLLGHGKRVAEVVKALGISEVTYYRWRQEFGGMTTAPASLPTLALGVASNQQSRWTHSWGQARVIREFQLTLGLTPLTAEWGLRHVSHISRYASPMRCDARP